MLRMAHRRWICLAKLLLEAEQGNWTASLCRVAFLKRSQKFSNSSSSSSDVFSNTAMTSVVTMLYTTKNEGWGERQRLLRRAQLGKLSLPSPHITPQTLSKFLHSTGESYILTLIHSPIGIPQHIPNYPPLSCDYLQKLNRLPIFQLELNTIVFSSSLSSTKSNALAQVPNLIFIPADKITSDPVLSDLKLFLPLHRYIISSPPQYLNHTEMSLFSVLCTPSPPTKSCALQVPCQHRNENLKDINDFLMLTFLCKMALVPCCGLAMAMNPSTNEQEIGKKGDIVSVQLHQREMTFPSHGDRAYLILGHQK